MKLLKGAKQP